MHLTILYLSLPLIKSNPILFIFIEIVLAICFIYALRLYKKLLKPLELIRTGIENLNSQDFNNQLIKIGQVELDELIIVYNKMISKLHNEHISHQEKHFFLEKLITSSPSGIIIYNLDGQISSINPAAIQIFNLYKTETDFIGKKLEEINHFLASQIITLTDGEAQIFNLHNIKSYKCQKAHFQDRGFKHYFVMIEELTDEIFQAEKQAYEKIIRIMSHEVNNSIGAINSILESFKYYQNQLNSGDKKDYLNALTVSIDRNSSLNNFMANYAKVVRLPKPNKVKTELTALVKSILMLMKSKADNEKINLMGKIPDKDIFVMIDKEQFEQVLVNIFKNSIESIVSSNNKSAGLIEIEVISISDNRIKICIKDNGCGIDNQIQADLFKPFFSSKKYGQGVGLTLVKEILLNHQCDFELKTDVLTGITSFTIII